jgi:hypothetical protein
MPRRERPLPPGLVPRYLSREQAAAYDGVSVDTFDYEVRAGLWPAARAGGAKGGLLTWDVALLNAAADREAGLAPMAPAEPAPDVHRAWKERLNAAAAQQHREAGPKAAGRR